MLIKGVRVNSSYFVCHIVIFVFRAPHREAIVHAPKARFLGGTKLVSLQTLVSGPKENYLWGWV